MTSPSWNAAALQRVLQGAAQEGWNRLVVAQTYAEQSDNSSWDFAVELSELERVGLTRNELRLLLAWGLVEHAREVTGPESSQREFQTEGLHQICPNSCFILSSIGRDWSFRLSAEIPPAYSSEVHAISARPGEKSSSAVPHWNSITRELFVGRVLVKRFRRTAPLQEMILNAFEEEGWPVRIDDPLPRTPGLVPHLHLREVIRRLNRHQCVQRIRFHGDGSGEGVSWELIGHDLGIHDESA